MEKIREIYNKVSVTVYLAYLFFLNIVLVLYVNNAYFDIMEAKANLFVKIVRFLFPFVIAVLGIGLYLKRKEIKLSLLYLSLLTLLGTSFISTICSFSRIDAFTGMQGWYVGFCAISFLIFSILSFKDIKPIKQYWYIPLLLVFFFEYVLIFTDGMDLDLLGYKEELVLTSHFLYFGTLGNSNWIVGFLSLTVPMFICLYLSEERRIYRLFYLLVSIFGVIASIINGADGVYFSFTSAFIVLIPVVLNNLVCLKRFSVLLIVVSCFLIAMGYDYHFVFFLEFFNSIGRFLFEPKYTVIILILSIILFGISISFKEKKYQKYRKRIVLYTYILLFILLIGTVVFVFKSQNNIGSYRFELWNYSIKAFEKYPFIKKLIGYGPELVRNFYAAFSARYGVIYNTSHSEPVQMLMTMGILGLISWVFCWISVFFVCYQKREIRIIQCLFAGLLAYFFQSFLNSATLPNVCLLATYVILLNQYQK